jgi:FkbM family methyltransferase
MKRQYNRLINLFKITTFQEFLLILLHQFFKHNKSSSFVPLQRLLIFTIACTDNHIQISKKSGTLLFLSWEEEGRLMHFFLRKYTRDLLVFSEFFINKEFIKYIEPIQTNSKEDLKLIIDAGANIGCSALFFHLYFQEAKIICIEPEESNYNLLNKNINANNASSKIISVQKALWNEITELNLRQRDWSPDGFHVMQKSVQDEIISRTATTTIPELIKDFGYHQIDLLKIDIEGAEKIIFTDKSHVELFIKRTRHLIIDVHEEFVNAHTIFELLMNYEFEFEQIQNEGQATVIIARAKS